MVNDLASGKRIFRPAVFPVFSIFFIIAFATAIVTFISGSSSRLRMLDSLLLHAFITFLLPLAITVSAIVTFLIWRFTAEVLSTDSVEIFTFFGRRRLSWEQVVAVRTFPSLKLVYIRFSLRSGRFKRVLFFQRRTGELREMIEDMVSKESFVWKQLKND
jgi:hypothetical protein